MPLTKKGSTILAAMQEEYGSKKGKSVLYASSNKGTITGVHASSHSAHKGKKKHRKKRHAY